MTRVSASTLFHFTDSLSNLESILTFTFYPRYCLEDYSSFYDGDIVDNLVYIPMVSFCDIPLSQINEHSLRYGKYAIGLSKNWANRNMINPLFYLTERSIQYDLLRQILGLSRKGLISNKSELNSKAIFEQIGGRVNNFFRYFKPYRGTSNKEDRQEIVFYNEREWRYIPNVEELDQADLPSMLFPDDMYGVDRNTYNRQLERNISLSFEPNDIEYIIVRSESERLEIAKKIQFIKRRYSDDERLLLITKILSMEKIESDF